MKIETTAGALLSALKVVAGAACKGRESVPVLGAVLFDGATVTATDLDMTITATFASVSAKGSSAILRGPLMALVGHIPAGDSITIEAGAEGATVTFSAGRYDLPAFDPKDFPELAMGGLVPVEFDGEKLRDAIAFVRGFVSTEETRYYLNGVCLDGDMAVATNGRQLGCHPSGGNFADRLIVPRPALGLLSRLAATSAAVNKRHAAFEFPGISLRTKLIDGTFSDWRRVVPQADPVSTITFDTRELRACLSRLAHFKGASVFGSREPCATLMWDDARLTVVSDIAALSIKAREYLSKAKIDGAPGMTAFNAGYLSAVANLFKEETFTVGVTDSNSPSIIRAGGEPYVILMPMRSGAEALAAQTLSEWAAAMRPALHAAE